MGKQKLFGIELARIISIFMIVLLHCLGKGGILENCTVFSANWIVSYLIENFCYGAVNVYALISGYVCIHSKGKYNRIVNLWFEVFLISVSIAFLFLALPQFSLRKSTFIFSFFPITTGEYWYVTSYLCVFTAIPLLNAAIKNISKDNLIKIIICGFIYFTIFNIVGYLHFGDLFKVSSGYSPIWLIFLYIVGAYLQLYPPKKISKYICIILYFSFSIINTSVFFLIKFLSNKIDHISTIDILKYNSPFIFLGSLFLFLFFTKFTTPPQKKQVII